MQTEHVRRDLRAMNSDIELVACGEGAERRLNQATRWLGAYEERYSRFRILSELSRLNAAAGRQVRVSPGLLYLIELSLQLASRSGGLFDPTILSALESAGYNRSFELLRPPARRTGRRKAPGWQDVGVDRANRTVTLPDGAGIDLGGIGKGWAVDRMASILGEPCLVNGGGDVFARARPPDEDGWRVGIANPFEPDRDLMVLQVTNRGVATSSTLKRRWQAGGVTPNSAAVLHHLIDPRTGRPSISDAVQVTVVAASATLADYHAKVALLQGSQLGLAYINTEPDVAGLVVSKDGRVLESDGLRDFQA